MSKEKVSIIVPIYKVEQYIHRCIDSILNQTYKNLEIILVNDGSPDNCGAIIEAYQETDRRIYVYHKENGGLSDARNYGMQKVTGEFTMFVDSDDWLDHHMVETMVQYSRKYEADIIQSAFYYAYDKALFIDHRYDYPNKEPIVLDNKSLMYELIKNNIVKNFAWGKLYRTTKIKTIPFKKGVIFEDVFWAHHVMHEVDCYVMIYDPFYYYYQRDDSIVATYTLKNLDIIRGLQERHQFIEKNYDYLQHDSYQLILNTCFTHYRLLNMHRHLDDRKTYQKRITHYINSHIHEFKRAVKTENQLKVQLLLFTIHPSLMILFQKLVTGLQKTKLMSTPTQLKQVNI